MQVERFVEMHIGDELKITGGYCFSYIMYTVKFCMNYI
jgi:hypothetical protein